MRCALWGSVVVVLGLVALGCLGDGGSHGNPDGGGAGDGGSGGGGGSAGGFDCDSTLHCGGSGFVCGVHRVASCGEVDCGPCRFGASDLGWGDITAAPDRSIHVALIDTAADRVVYGRAQDGGLQEQTVAADVSASSTSIAVAPDGTVHVVFIADQVMHATRAPGAVTWDIEVASEFAESAAVAVDAAGAPHIVLVQEHPQTRQRQLIHVTRVDTTYSHTTLDLPMAIGKPSIARGPDGSIAVVIRSDIMQLGVFDLVDGSFVRDMNVPAVDDQPAEWSAAIGTDGTLHIVSLLGHYTLRTGSQLVSLTRSSAVWTIAPVGGTPAQVTRGIFATTGPTDTLHLAYYARNADGLFYTRAGSTHRLNVQARCDDGDVRFAIDEHDQPHILYSCDSVGGSYITPVTRYSDAYISACDQAAALICDRACECGTPDCCYGDGTADGSRGCFFGPGDTKRNLCVTDMLIGLCSDITADPAELLDCKPLLDATEPMCVDARYTIPTPCLQLISSNR